ncbi:MAG: cation-transporting P-type ATPase [Hyphomicrobium sp.]
MGSASAGCRSSSRRLSQTRSMVPASWKLVAYLCVGWPAEEQPRSRAGAAWLAAAHRCGAAYRAALIFGKGLRRLRKYMFMPEWQFGPLMTNQQKPQPYWARSQAELFSEYGSSRNGLTQGEAARRLAVHGGNSLVEQHQSGIATLLLRQYQSPWF